MVIKLESGQTIVHFGNAQPADIRAQALTSINSMNGNVTEAVAIGAANKPAAIQVPRIK